MLHIQANNVRNKMCGPISGYQKGKINQSVLRDQESAKIMIKFKYPDYVIDDGNTSIVWIYSTLTFVLEALRKTGNLEIKKNVFFEENMLRNKGKITYAEVLIFIQL